MKINEHDVPSETESCSEKDCELIDLERKARKASFRHREWIKTVAVISAAVICFSITLVYSLHLIIPADKRWLTAEDLEQIRHLAISVAVGVGASLANSYFLPRR